MKRVWKKAIAAGSLLVLTVAVLTGCTNKITASTENSDVVLTDMTGKQIALTKPAEKFVALSPTDCEVLYALGVGDGIAGRGEYCDYPEDVQAVQVVEAGGVPSLEQIIALQPDVVFLNSMNHEPEQIQAMEAAGLTVVESNPQNIEEVYQYISILGSVVGRDHEATAIVDNMKQTFDKVEKQTSDKLEKQALESEKSGKTVYFEVSPLEYGLWTAGANTFMDEIAAMVGLENVFSDVQGWAEVSQEQVIERNPDYIVTVTMYDGTGESPVEEIMKRNGWQTISAVKEGQVLQIDSNEITRPGPRLKDAAGKLSEFIYGE